MTFFDLLFENKTVDNGIILNGYKFYSVTPDGKFLYYKKADSLIDTEQYMFNYLNIDEAYYFYTPDWEERADDDLIYLDYSHIEPLLSVTVEGTLDRNIYPKCRKQFVAIRGICDHQCPKNLPDNLSGYSLHKLPSCDGKYVGTTVWTGKINNNEDTIKDIWDWLSYCKGLDVLIINFDNTPTPFDDADSRIGNINSDILIKGSNPDIKTISDLDFDSVCFCALVRGSTIRFINDVAEIEQLYHEYSSKYWCIDYDIEDSINSYYDSDHKFRRLIDEEGAFRLERPKGSKE